jgi:hypothetical protein
MEMDTVLVVRIRALLVNTERYLSSTIAVPAPEGGDSFRFNCPHAA